MSNSSKFFSAEAYEDYMGRWSRLLAARFIDFVGLRDGERLLDVGCGTGSLALAVAALTSRSEIVGIDPSAPFIEYARLRGKDPRLTFKVGDALSISYPDASFDKCLSLLVIMFIQDVAPAIAEMRRVTRHGGIVAACVWDRSGMEMNSVFWKTAVELDPAAERRRDAQAYSGGQLSSLWAESGFTGIEETALVIPLEFKSFDDFWTPLLGGQGPSASYLLGLPSDRQLALRERLREKVLGAGPERPFKLKAKAWAVHGVR